MIPYLDLQAQYRGIQDELEPAVLAVLRSGHYVLGGEVQRFEEEFASYCRAKHAVGVNTGTSALHLALLASGIGKGDEVITPPLTFVATVAAIVYAGATPVFVDVDPGTLCLDPGQLERAVTRKTKAVLPVHLHGFPADMDPIREVARRKKLVLIEDAAQAHGAEYKGKRAGSMGDLACFSFYPGKNLGACGEGGAVTTDDPKLAEKIKVLRDWGAKKRYHHDLKGFNYRMEAVQGAVLRVKLRRLEEWTEKRRALARFFDAKLGAAGITTPPDRDHARHVYHVYAVRVPKRDALRDHLASLGIQSNIHYPIPVHLQKAHADLGYKKRDFPVAEDACRKLLSLPLYPELTQEQAGTIVDEVVRFYGKKR